MRQKSHVRAEQFPLRFDSEAELEQLIERRVALHLEAGAFRWRFRLIALDTVLLVSLVLATGLAVGESAYTVVRTAILVGASCFAAGMLLIGLSSSAAKLLTRVRQRRMP